MNLMKLDAELKTACPRVIGCASTGRVDFVDGRSWRPGDPTPDADTQVVATVVAAHDSSDTQDQKLARRGYTHLLAALVEIASKGRANAPTWARSAVDAAAAEIDEALK